MHDSVPISSVDTGPKRVTRIHHFMLHTYYSITKQRFSTLIASPNPHLRPHFPTHWLPLVLTVNYVETQIKLFQFNIMVLEQNQTWVCFLGAQASNCDRWSHERMQIKNCHAVNKKHGCYLEMVFRWGQWHTFPYILWPEVQIQV